MIRFARVSPASVLVLVIGDALLLLGCYVLAARWTQIADLPTYLFYSDGLLNISIVVIAFQLGLYFEGLYEHLVPPYRLIRHVCLITGATFLLQALFQLGNWDLRLEKFNMIYGTLLVLVLFPAWRLFFSVLIKAVPLARLLFIGATPEIDEVARHLKEQPAMGLSVLGYIDSGQVSLSATPKLGALEDFENVITEYAPQRIIVSNSPDSAGSTALPVRRLLELQLNGMQVEEFDPFYESILGRISAFSLAPSRLIFSTELDPAPAMQTLQNIYSMTLAAVLLIVTLPLTLWAALLIKLTSTGPVFVRERRVGLGGAPLDLLLFRTCSLADGKLTSVGALLKKTRIEKLPLLWNVLRAEMSLVGPKAVRPEFAAVLERQIPFYRHRYSVKPGLTGWAQNHSSRAVMDDTIEKLEYDFYYIRNLAISLDAHILLRTLTTLDPQGTASPE